MDPNLEKSGNFCSHEFDLLADFNQFLEEAKHHANGGNSKSAHLHAGETRNGENHGEKRNKKSWKSSLFSWLKMDKKNKTVVSRSSTTIKGRRNGIVSGPMQSSSSAGNSISSSRSRKPTSGPLMNLFNPSKREEEDGVGPYMCLNHLNNNPQDTAAHSYGPVYLVT